MPKPESIYHDEKSGPNFGKTAHEHLNICRLFIPSLMPVVVNKLHQRLVGCVLETLFCYRPRVPNVNILLQYSTLCGGDPGK